MNYRSLKFAGIITALAALVTVVMYSTGKDGPSLVRSLFHSDIEISRTRKYLEREKTAGDILKKQIPQTNVNDLFINKWIPPPGWSGSVKNFPKHDEKENGWRFTVIETGTYAEIKISGAEQGEKIRPGDLVSFLGRIKEIRYPNTILLEEVEIQSHIMNDH